jgi:hypothetical protein
VDREIRQPDCIYFEFVGKRSTDPNQLRKHMHMLVASEEGEPTAQVESALQLRLPFKSHLIPVDLREHDSRKEGVKAVESAIAIDQTRNAPPCQYGGPAVRFG